MPPERVVDEVLFAALDAAITGTASAFQVPDSLSPATLAAVLQAAERGQLDVVVAEGLETLGVPSASLNLEARRALARYRAVLLEDERRRIDGALSSAEIPHLHLKGTFHDALLYGARGSRGSHDIDVLVPREFEALAISALSGLGYSRRRSGTHPATEDSSRARLLSRQTAAGSTDVDLHVGLLNEPPFKDPALEVLSRAVTYPTPVGPIRGMALEDMLLHLAANLAQDRFKPRLPLAVDAALLIASKPLDLELVVQRARAWGCATAAWALLALIAARFSAPIPEDLLDGLRPPLPIARWVSRIAGVSDPPMRQPRSTSTAVLKIEWPLSGRLLWPWTAASRWAHLRFLDRLRLWRESDRGEP